MSNISQYLKIVYQSFLKGLIMSAIVTSQSILNRTKHEYSSIEGCSDITIFDVETRQTLDLAISLAYPQNTGTDNLKTASRIDVLSAL